MPDWKQAIARWHELPEKKKHRRRLLSIPQNGAQSMVFEGKALSIEILEAEQKKRYPDLFAQVVGATAARYSLINTTLPQVEGALRVGECFRQAVMSVAGNALGKHQIPAVFSGHNLPVGNHHKHAFYLPEDADGDGRIDHVLLYIPDGIDQEYHHVLARMIRLWIRKGQEWRLALDAISNANVLADSCALCRKVSSWTSVTPYLHPWHAKKNFTAADQIRRECRERGLPEIQDLHQIPSIRIQGRELRPIHFHRFRNKRNLVQPDTHGSFWRITFVESIPGPLALGFACHFGLGLFAPCE